MKFNYLLGKMGMMLLLALLLIQFPSLAQTKKATASGTISNEKGQPIEGVTVLIVNEKTPFKRVIQSNSKGVFNISGLDAHGSFSFTFSHIGYAEKTLTAQTPDASGNIDLSVKMELSTAGTNEEVVVIGYGKASRKDVTGSIKTIRAGDFNKGIINSPEELLQGKVAGVNVTSASGEPGSSQSITIRGPGGIRTDNTPLYVIDGLPLDNASTGGTINPLSFINPTDIESIDVLKDASATAIYGTRGANGVVIVTTKKGKSGSSNLNYTFNGGFSKMARKLPVFSAEEYKKQVTALGGTLQDFKGNTDWQDEISRTSFSHNHNIALSGGANKFTYYASGGLQQQNGILKGNDVKRYNGRFNMTQRLLEDRLLIEMNLAASNVVNKRPSIGSLIGGALSTNPTLPAYGEDGKPYAFQNGTNPLLTLSLDKDITTTNRVLGNLSGSLTLMKGLVYKINFGVDNSSASRDIQSLPNQQPLRTGSLAAWNFINRNYLVENYLTYITSFGKHKLTALAGHSYQKFWYQDRVFNVGNFPVSQVEPIYDPGTGTDLTSNRPKGTANTSELQSFFGRVNYQFNEKYLLTATLRADGSSKFGSNNRYGYFPSFSAAWVASKEEFMRHSIFSNLKLRAGYGQTGNQEIPPKITLAYFQSNTNSNNSYPLYPGNTYPSGTTYSRFANPDIQWEVSSQADAGVDFELLNGALSGTVDYFRKVTSKMLLKIIPADPIVPFQEQWTNAADMKVINEGLELDLSYKHTTAFGVTYSVGGNITFINNNVKNSPYSIIPSGSASGSGLTSATINGYVNGQPIGTFYMLEFTGFDANGKSTYRDVNNDKLVNDKDRQPLGSALPKKMFNAWFNLYYKGFDLNANFNGVAGNKIYDNTANANFYKLLLSKGVNTTAEAIKYPQEAVTNEAPVSSRFLKSGDFFRLNNLTLGYNFNTRKLGISRWASNLRLSLTGQNLFVITPYNGYDPEVNTDRTIDGVLSYGIDYLSYPKARSFLLGLNVTF